MKINDSDLFFTCSLIELIGRSTKQKRSAVVVLLGKKVLSHIYSNAGVLHCEPIAKNADAFIEMCNIPEGTFDNVADCKYEVPDYWTIGKVFARLIEDVASGNAIETLQEVYLSPVCDAISNYNSDFFYQPRGFIKEFYLDECKNSPKKRKTPALRFAGFTDAWEQRKVGELLIERNEQAPANDDFPLMAFIANIGVSPKGDRYDRSSLVSDVENKLYKRTRLGDFIYSSNNLETGSIGLNKYGNASISPVYSIFYATELADAEFLGRRFVRKDFINAMIKWRQGVIYGQWRIHESDFIKIKIAVPSVKEQRKIGKLLDELDRLITLHQRKYDKLTKVKKSMLEKMFPKNGSDVPEIRFSGFTDAWEQRKLEMLASFSKGAGYSKNDLLSSGTPIILYGRLYTKYETNITIVNTFVAAKSGSIYSRGGEVIVPASGETAEDISIAAVVENKGVILGGDLNIITPGKDLDPTFLALTISFGNAHKELSRFAQGKSVVHLHNADLKIVDISYPKCKEQQKIGAFFQTLDRLITLHQRELDRLQKIKKSCLEKMFV